MDVRWVREAALASMATALACWRREHVSEDCPRSAPSEALDDAPIHNSAFHCTFRVPRALRLLHQTMLAPPLALPSAWYLAIGLLPIALAIGELHGSAHRLDDSGCGNTRHAPARWSWWMLLAFWRRPFADSEIRAAQAFSGADARLLPSQGGRIGAAVIATPCRSHGHIMS